MRRSYIDLPKRLPQPRKARLRARLIPVAVALPLVVVLWLTIGLPMLAVFSQGGAGRRPPRENLLRKEPPAGGPAPPPPTGDTNEKTTDGQKIVLAPGPRGG